jgi:hypothetical protein
MNKIIIYFIDKTLKETVTWFCPRLCHNRRFIITGNVEEHKWWRLHNMLCDLERINELNRVTNNNVQHKESRTMWRLRCHWFYKYFNKDFLVHHYKQGRFITKSWRYGNSKKFDNIMFEGVQFWNKDAPFIV